LEQIEARAFEPLWRHSVSTLRLAWQHTVSFDVAAVDGQVVGFQFSTPSETGAHLARLTVHPSFQGKGIGSHLMAYALAGYRRQGLKAATLNTQADNDASQNLYKRFGFQPNGQKFPVWVVDL
jgi:ribosomal protein S18 acetylase RimI-like enzyme